MIIDWQHHFSPEQVFTNRGGKSGQAFLRNGKVAEVTYLRPEAYQIDKHLEFMDAAGIDMAVLSLTWDTVEECKLTDDSYIKLMKEYPRRVVGLAPCIPTRWKLP